MPALSSRSKVEELLATADIRVGGERPWDVQVHEPRFFARVLAQGSLGLGESYMDGWWDAPSLDGFLFQLLHARVDERVHSLGDVLAGVKARVVNMQSMRRAFTVGRRHYDLGNDLYSAMLGQRLVYSCAYWRDATGMPLDDLDAAQEAKLDLVCRKLDLGPGLRVLDIGCGWGEALKFAAERYGVSGVGVTVSKEQAEYARRLCEGLPVEIRLQDYREVDERFDRAFSIGMFEHVGVRNYDTYFETARRCLDPRNGLLVLHTIGGNHSVRHTDRWIAKYIFPNSMLPSAEQITQSVEGRFVIEDWHNFGTDYDRTLQAWRDNLDAAWASLPPQYDQRFRRMWRFYLCASMATFRSRRAQLWQVVLSPEGVPGGYVAPR
ncbi:cyclopropane-fatty-acyl-phospholipid synthase [Lysobacter niastensis]|uniref:Cyclopropane-fatty-acyl-phospholipid synthase n=1 Tax=Lysobacter niastensis TaxID=380629 RepID=A0ABU1WEB2_9GAMM|nr:cyclopropane fatty acyl phospholipid synthase [Lysobacter niastensis]MDR7135935.1 cyclopropane-fatty-acyl-phospholipid synthase [Lysobacter niastensis]